MIVFCTPRRLDLNRLSLRRLYLFAVGGWLMAQAAAR